MTRYCNEATRVHHTVRRRGLVAARGARAAGREAQGSIRIAPLITSPMTTLVQSKYLTHDCSLSLMAATTRNALSMNHAPIITSSVRMDGAENGGLTWVTRWKEPLSLRCHVQAPRSFPPDACHVNMCPVGLTFR